MAVGGDRFTITVRIGRGSGRSDGDVGGDAALAGTRVLRRGWVVVGTEADGSLRLELHEDRVRERSFEVWENLMSDEQSRIHRGACLCGCWRRTGRLRRSATATCRSGSAGCRRSRCRRTCSAGLTLTDTIVSVVVTVEGPFEGYDSSDHEWRPTSSSSTAPGSTTSRTSPSGSPGTRSSASPGSRAPGSRALPSTRSTPRASAATSRA